VSPASDRTATLTGPAWIGARGWGWRHASRRAAAIEGLDLEIRPRERVLIAGPSGSGKSTLLAGLAGILGGPEDGEERGELLIDGIPAASARGRAAMVLQDPETQLVMSRIGDEVAFGLENLGVPDDEIWPRVTAALDAVGLGAGGHELPLEHPTSALSGGQKQRLALACAIAMRPGVLILDEPTANLDPQGVIEVRDAVVALVDTTLVIVEHRVGPWLEHVDRVIVLDRGRVVRDIPARECIVAPGPRPVPIRHGIPGTAAIEAVELAIGRDGHAIRDGISLAVAPGEALAIIGPNGSGKSTLALTLAGLMPPISGEVRIGGRPGPHRWRSRALLPEVGMVFQSPEHQFLARTVRAELEVGPRALSRRSRSGAAETEQRIRDRTDALLDRLRLLQLAPAHPFTLSGGQQRRLSVGTALATSPRVLILDEPTFGQDPRTLAALLELLTEALDAGAAVIVVTHDADVPAALGARVLELA